MQRERAQDRGRRAAAGAFAAWLTGTLAALGLALGSCQEFRRTNVPPVEATSSRVDLFVRCPDAAARAVRFELEAVEVRDESGALRPLTVSRPELRSSELMRRVAVAGAVAPPAHYVALVLRVRGAWLQDPQGEVALRLVGSDEPEADQARGEGRSFEVPIDVRLGRRDAVSVFLDWSAADSLRGGLSFVPSFTPSLEKPQTSLGLLYVCDAARGSVLSIDRATGEVVGTFKTGDAPSAMVLLRDRRRLFVANTGDGSLSVLDVRLGRVESTLPIAFGGQPADVVVADPLRWVAAANPGLDSVVFASIGVDARTRSVSVGRQPVRLAAAPGLRRVYVVEQGADSLAVIDTSTLTVVARSTLEARPSDIDVDREERELYVGHLTSPNLLVLDARTLAVVDTIFLGGSVTDVLTDPRRSRIYVARSSPPEILVVERRVRAAVMRIPVSGRITAMTLSRDGSELWATVPDDGAVLVVDVLTGAEQGSIHVGARPMDVVIAE